jgi:predicted transcriptional regulator
LLAERSQSWELPVHCTRALVKMPDGSRYGCVNFDLNYNLTSFDEKTPDKKRD